MLSYGRDSSGIELNPLDPVFLTDPYPALNAMRERTSVYHDRLLNRYMLLRHYEVDWFLRDHVRFSHDPRNAAEGTPMRMLLDANSADQQGMLFLDAPDHTRLRGLVNRAFTPRAVEALRPRVQQIADELLDRIADQPTVDLVASLAAPFPTTVIAEMIGVDPADQPQFRVWSDLVVQVYNPLLSAETRERIDQAWQALDEYFRRVIAERRTAPRDDLVGGLIVAQCEGDRLSDDEMVNMLQILLVAGNVTTADMIGNSVIALLEHRDQMERLRDDLSLLVNAVEEMLRYAPSVVQTGRTALVDLEIAGCPIAAGQTVIASLAAANRDPRVYPDPNRFDITRADTHHHSFGGGPHYCLGAALARMETQVAIDSLLRRFPNLSLQPGTRPHHRADPKFRGPVALPVAVS